MDPNNKREVPEFRSSPVIRIPEMSCTVRGPLPDSCCKTPINRKPEKKTETEKFLTSLPARRVTHPGRQCRLKSKT